METYFKTKLAELLLQDNGEPVNATQIYLINFDDNCPAKNNVDKASLLFYVMKADGTVDKDMTKQAFKILYYLAENKLGRILGPVFELKVTSLNFLAVTVYLLILTVTLASGLHTRARLLGARINTECEME